MVVLLPSQGQERDLLRPPPSAGSGLQQLPATEEPGQGEEHAPGRVCGWCSRGRGIRSREGVHDHRRPGTRRQGRQFPDPAWEIVITQERAWICLRTQRLIGRRCVFRRRSRAHRPPLQRQRLSAREPATTGMAAMISSSAARKTNADDACGSGSPGASRSQAGMVTLRPPSGSGGSGGGSAAASHSSVSASGVPQSTQSVR